MAWQICKQKVAELWTSKEDFLWSFATNKWFLHHFIFRNFIKSVRPPNTAPHWKKYLAGYQVIGLNCWTIISITLHVVNSVVGKATTDT